MAAGLQRTGWIITSAALLLAVVIGAFSTSGVTFIKMIGVGMIIAILLDATVVRVLLVPATMRLLGRYNWWAPPPLARFWQRAWLAPTLEARRWFVRPRTSSTATGTQTFEARQTPPAARQATPPGNRLA